MSNIVEPKVYEIVKKAVNGDIENFEVSVESTNKKGEGYSGPIFFILVKDKSNGKQLHLVVKQAFSEQTIRDFSPIREIFLNEIYFYTEAWPKLLKFQERVPKTYHFNHSAKCLATISEDNFERLVLENLKYEGFVMHDKKKALNREHFEFIFRIYGRFHAVSFAYKALYPKEFSEIGKTLCDVYGKSLEKDASIHFNSYIHRQCLESLQPGSDDAIIEKYKHYVKDGVKLFREALVNRKYTALIHGDCWSNNMMFKYDDGNIDQPTDMRFIDLQLSRVASPILDLSCYLYTCADKAVLNHFDFLLQAYHTSLSDSLREFGCNSEDVLTYNQLKRQWGKYGRHGLALALLIIKIELCQSDEVVDFAESAEKGQALTGLFDFKLQDQDQYEKRVLDILSHFAEFL